MRRIVFVAAGLCASIAAAPVERAAQVTIHVAVENQNGVPVRGLSADKFSLSVDRVARPVESVVPADQPLSTILLADGSPSMKPFAGRLEMAALGFVESLGAADRWRTGEFGDRIIFSRDFASGRKFRLEPREPLTLRERTVRGGSPLWDAVHQSIELLSDQPGRRTLLVFSDARASGNASGLEDVANLAADNAVSVSAIVPARSYGIRQDPETIAVISSATGLERFARYTGGVLLGGYDFKGDPLKQLPALAARLRAGYALTFSMPEDGRRHRLDVRVATDGLQVRAPIAFRVARDGR